MTQYRVIDPEGKVLDTAEFDDTTAAYDWFKNVEVPSDTLGYALEVHGDGEWRMVETADGGTSTDDAAAPGESGQ